MMDKFFFVYSHSRIEKSYLYETIISYFRLGHIILVIILVVISLDILSLLLSCRYTTHSRFKISIKINENSICDIKKETQLIVVIYKTSLII